MATSLLRTCVRVALGRMKSCLFSHIEFGHSHYYCSLPASPWQPSSAWPAHPNPGFCGDGSGAELGEGSGEVTLEATLCVGISPGSLLSGRNEVWSWLKVTWRPGQACVWQLINAQAEWAVCVWRGWGVGGEFPLCQQQPRLWGVPPLWIPRSL